MMIDTPDHTAELKDAAAKLLLAAGLVEQAIGPLNVDHSQCHHCGAERYRSFAESRAHRRLTEMAAKLRQWAGTLENPDTFPDARRGLEEEP